METTQQRRRDEVDVEPDVEDERQDGAAGDELAVREVRQAGRAEDERQADRRHGDDQPELQPADEQLRCAVEPRGVLGVALPEREQGRREVRGPHRDGAPLRRALAQGDALGERGRVEHDLVGAGAGQRDLEGAAVVGDRRADLGAVLLHADGHAGHALAAVAQRAAHPLAPGLLAQRARCCGRGGGQQGEQEQPERGEPGEQA
jgi:hypothetical protein